jgi:hypothetical protein
MILVDVRSSSIERAPSLRRCKPLLPIQFGGAMTRGGLLNRVAHVLERKKANSTATSRKIIPSNAKPPL